MLQWWVNSCWICLLFDIPFDGDSSFPAACKTSTITKCRWYFDKISWVQVKKGRHVSSILVPVDIAWLSYINQYVICASGACAFVIYFCHLRISWWSPILEDMLLVSCVLGQWYKILKLGLVQNSSVENIVQVSHNRSASKSQQQNEERITLWSKYWLKKTSSKKKNRILKGSQKQSVKSPGKWLRVIKYVHN